MKKSPRDYIYVSLQLLLFVVYVIPIAQFNFSNSFALSIIGRVMIVLGICTGLLAMIQLNKNLSPFPTPKSNSELVQTGLYKYIRHPIYTGILLTCIGYALNSGSFYKLIITSLLGMLFIIKSNYEEKRLSQKFDIYNNYRIKTGRFLPKLF